MRRPLLASLAALAAGASLVAAPLAAAAPAAGAEPPRTGFERSDGTEWTSLEDEARFLRQVDRDSDRVSIRTIARTAQDRPVRMVQIGSGPRSQQEVAEGSTLLLLCLQHGNEPAGREACLSTVRDLAYATDARTQRLLDRTTVLVVPTFNPDGRAADTRQNSAGVDLNRDHLVLTQPETQGLARVLRDLRPDVLHDAHEYGGTPELYDRDLISLWPRNRNVDDRVHALARQLSLTYVNGTVEDAGFSTGIYGIYNGPDGEPVAQVAGDEDERILRNLAGLRHVAGLLVETRIDDGLEDDPEGNVRRVNSQLAAVRGTLSMVLEKRTQLARQTAAARERAAQEGASGDSPYYLGGADNRLPERSEVLFEPPCAYELTAEQFSSVRRTLTLHGIETTRSGGTVTVSMAQEAQPVIPLLLDERAEYEVAAGTPVACGA
ncbi:M14 family metallopeptidase [Vallicoccus soli]|uniref:Carboxypeptidase n=1 Tax=Vallicoccus soli TaxID=2339232 RepID=A0A3A3YW00_9ACTN|nr:M14 family metallocarboxypeptidase [Vallicoccus soli]RJK94867.1 carboxypeptidase [Vallicoccus soli]